MHAYFNNRKILLSYKIGNKRSIENNTLYAYFGCDSLIKFKENTNIPKVK